MADDNEDFVSGALSSIEGIQGLDEDTIAYVSGVLAEDPFDDDARSAVRELLVGALEDYGDLDGVSVCDSLFGVAHCAFRVAPSFVASLLFGSSQLILSSKL